MAQFNTPFTTGEEFREFALYAEEFIGVIDSYPLHVSSKVTSHSLWEQLSGVAKSVTGNGNLCLSSSYPLTSETQTVERMFWYLYGLMLDDGAV